MRESRQSKESKRPKESEQPERRERRERSTSSTSSTGAGRGANSRIGARRAAALAAKYVVEMTGRQPEGLTSLSHTEDGWRVDVEALESKRIPDSTDILAVYRVELDDEGELLSYSRAYRYHRGRVEGDDQ